MNSADVLRGKQTLADRVNGWKLERNYYTPPGWMVGQSVWTPGVKTVWYIPGVKTVWYVHACFICSCFHSPLLTSERSKLVLQLKAENLPLSSWWLWHQQLNIYRSKNNVSVDKRGGPAAEPRCDLSFFFPPLPGKTSGFNVKGVLFFFFFFCTMKRWAGVRRVKGALWCAWWTGGRVQKARPDVKNKHARLPVYF